MGYHHQVSVFSTGHCGCQVGTWLIHERLPLLSHRGFLHGVRLFCPYPVYHDLRHLAQVAPFFRVGHVQPDFSPTSAFQYTISWLLKSPGATRSHRFKIYCVLDLIFALCSTSNNNLVMAPRYFQTSLLATLVLSFVRLVPDCHDVYHSLTILCLAFTLQCRQGSRPSF